MANKKGSAIKLRGVVKRFGNLTAVAGQAAFGWASFGIFIAGRAKSIESFSYWMSGLLTPMFLVAGAFFPISGLPQWVQFLSNFNPLFHCVELVRHSVFMKLSIVDIGHLIFLIVFALIAWRLSIHYLQRKLII